MTPVRLPWRKVTMVALALLAGGGFGSAWAAFSATTSNGTNSFSAAADTTAPTVARAVAAKTSGATPGTIRQGGDYYVYAQVTDAASGVSTVTANASSFDGGVTSASLSATGGPWTVGGQTYNYRTAVLTADTPLNTGSTYPYSLTATDVAGNQATPSYSVTIESYAAAIGSTTGLVSHWRLGDGAFSGDEYTDAAGTLLENHTGAIGASWTSAAGQARRGVISTENRLRKETGSGGALYYTSATPSSADYSVEADVHVKSLMAADAIGVVGRMDTAATADTFYLARYWRDTTDWDLYKVVNGTATELGFYDQPLTAGQTYRLTLDMSGSTIRLLVNGVQRVSVTDTAITGAGRGGVRLGTGGTGANVTDTAGLHLDDFRVTSRTTTAADSKGTNNGTYAGGARLNQPGALVGDNDRAALLDGVDDYITVPDAASLDLGDGPFTLEAWIKRGNTAGGWLNIMNKGANGYQFALYNSNLSIAKANCCTIVEGTQSLTDTTTWHHVVATKSGSAVKLYIDGVDRTSTVTNQTLANTTSALFLGSKAGTSEFLNAAFDEFAIYNTVLSAANVADHYAAGSGTG